MKTDRDIRDSLADPQRLENWQTNVHPETRGTSRDKHRLTEIDDPVRPGLFTKTSETWGTGKDPKVDIFANIIEL